MSLYCQNALGEAIKGDQVGVVELLLNGHADIEGIFTDGQKAIHLAARCDKKQIIKFLFHKGVDLYSLDEDKTSALQIAATEANLKALDALLKCGFNPNFVDGNGNAPIHGLGKSWRGTVFNADGFRSRRNYKKTVTKCLLEYGADPYLKDRDGSTPLLIASSLGLVREIETLLEHGVHPDGLDRDGHSDRAVSPDELEQMEKENPAELSRGNVETHLIQLNGTTPLCMAARVGSYDAAHLLLKQGANPNVKNQDGDTPLHLAVLRSEGNHLRFLVSLLIRKGASIDTQNSAGQSPLGVALKPGDIDLIETILEEGPRIECIDSTGVHPIFRALEYGHGRDRMSSMLLPPHIVDTGKGPSSDYQNRWEHWCSSCYSDEEEECERVIEWFLERGTDVNVRDPFGRSMLHQTAFQACTKSVKLLLGKGANPMAKNSFGQIPLHMACGDKLPDTEKVFEMLLEAGCDPNCKDENGDTPLHIAARSCYKTAISILRGGGRADLLATNNRGNTPHA